MVRHVLGFNALRAFLWKCPSGCKNRLEWVSHDEFSRSLKFSFFLVSSSFFNGEAKWKTGLGRLQCFFSSLNLWVILFKRDGIKFGRKWWAIALEMNWSRELYIQRWKAYNVGIWCIPLVVFDWANVRKSLQRKKPKKLLGEENNRKTKRDEERELGRLHFCLSFHWHI